MDEESLREACRRLDAAGIPYLAMRDIALLHYKDETKARNLLKDLRLNAEDSERMHEMDEFSKAVKPLMEYLKKRKSQTHGLDGAMVIATYEGVTLKEDRMGVPANQECNQGQNSDISSSSIPDIAMGQKRKGEHYE